MNECIPYDKPVLIQYSSAVDMRTPFSGHAVAVEAKFFKCFRDDRMVEIDFDTDYKENRVQCFAYEIIEHKPTGRFIHIMIMIRLPTMREVLAAAPLWMRQPIPFSRHRNADYR